MARIQPYESQISSQGEMPGRNATAQDFGGPGLMNLGNAIQSAGTDAAQVQRIVRDNASRQAVSDVHVFLSKAQAGYTQKAKEFETKADPSDQRLWDKFYFGGDGDPSTPVQGSLKYELDTYREQIQDANARRTFEQGAARMTAQFSDHFVTVQGRMAGVYANQQAIKLIDAAQTTVQTDPSQYETVLTNTLAAVDDPASEFGRLSAEQREPIRRKITEQVTSSTLYGLIREAPQLALHQLENGTWDKGLRGEDKVSLIRTAETAIRAQEIEKTRAAKAEEDARKERARAQETKLFNIMAAHEADPKQPALRADDPELLALAKDDPIRADTLLNAIHARAREDREKPQHTNPGTMRELVRRIHAPDGDPNKLVDNTAIYDAYDKGLLSFTDLKNLNTEFNDARTPEGQRLGQTKEKLIKAITPQLDHSNPLMGKIDRSGLANVYAFEQMVNRKIEEYRKAGKDVYSLFDPDPKNPDFVATPERLRPYQKHMMESIRDFSEQIRRAPGAVKEPTGGVPPEAQRQVDMPKVEGGRQTGESPEQYLKRVREAKEKAASAPAPDISAAPATVTPMPTAPNAAAQPDRVRSILKGHEGFRGQTYKDTTGNTTIGYGRNLDANPLTKEEGEMLLQVDIQKAKVAASRAFPWYDGLDPVRQDAVTMLVFNMGAAGLKGFRRFDKAIEDGRWDDAAESLNASKWASQVGSRRAATITHMIRTGRYSDIE